jgi:cullin-associated NEDD8-dissociated protein 1
MRKRLDNETTRAPALRALSSIARSPLALDLSLFLAQAAPSMALFLRQSSRALKQLTLQTLCAMLGAPQNKVDPTTYSVVLTEAAALLSDTDLHLAHLALQLALTLLAKAAGAAETGAVVYAQIYPKMLLLARSSLVQGPAQESLLSLFQAVVRLQHADMGHAQLFAQLYDVGDQVQSQTRAAALSKQALSNSSKCIASIITAADNDAVVQEALRRFTCDLACGAAAGGTGTGGGSSSSSSETRTQLALLCIGEVGQSRDLSAAGVKEAVLALFQSHSEAVKLAASFALGRMAVGNMDTFLPIILQQQQAAGQQQTQTQYLLLSALREVITVFANRRTNFAPFLAQVQDLLRRQCLTPQEEGVRGIVAECLGVLTSILPQHLLPLLLELASSTSASASATASGADNAEQAVQCRALAAHALRFALARPEVSAWAGPAAMDAVAASMGQFLVLLQDSDLEVKRAALLMVNTAAHHNPRSVAAQLRSLVGPALVETLRIKIERVVDLGPFKHKVDDNLPLRKVALTCVETIMDVLPDW